MARHARSAARSERFAARLTVAQKELFERAAGLMGRSLSDFVLNAAQAAAEETVYRYQILELTGRETEAFRQALERPPRLSRELEKALRDTSVETR
ncbi:MAG: type II toxin-antitoxin system TacA family antitoxin [Candidatus Xenobia bacterium]